MQPYTPSYLLLEEARKSWDHVVCNEIVHLLQVPEQTSDTLVGVAKDYVDGNLWIGTGRRPALSPLVYGQQLSGCQNLTSLTCDG